MKLHTPKHPMGRVIVILISIVSILGIAATYAIAGKTLYLPVVYRLEPTPSATETVEPTQPPDTLELVVAPSNSAKNWAVAFFAKSFNDAGRPIMAIYPRDTSPESERIKITKGEIVLALITPVKADGGGKFWQLIDYEGEKGETLFLKAADVTLLPPGEADN